MLSDSLKQRIRTIHQAMKLQLPGYQPRPGQNQMVAEIANVIAGSYHSYDRVALIEAGTGTGKSLAYLMAAVPAAQFYNKKLVIATATVALQEQLVSKDLPFFRQHSGLTFEFCLVKGRQRYACVEKIKRQLQQPDLFAGAANPSDLSLLPKWLAQWQAGQWSGDSDSLDDAVPPALWQLISADPQQCPRSHQHCPFHQSRQQAEQATVLVVNHALLLADLDSGAQILPAPEDCIYVIDEAHHLPDIGRDFFSAEAQLDLPERWLDKTKKLSQQLHGLLPQSGASTLCFQFDELWLELDKELRQLTRQISQQGWFSEKTSHRFADALLPDWLQKQTNPLAECSGKLLSVVEKLQQLLSDADTEHKVATKLTQPLQHELSLQQHRVQNQSELWQLLSVPQHKHVSQARWLEYQEHLTAHACPLSVSFMLDDLLFSQAFASILCSATLTTLNSFDHIRFELGLKDHEGVRMLRVASPFAYQHNASLLLPAMQTDPADDAFTDELIQVLPKFLDKTQGHLVLFASYWQMQQVAEGLRGQGWSLLVQGEASRQSLLDLHQKKINGGSGSILFGTQSFSEGLDLPGKLLTNLIITKLPFAVPSSPFEEAMAEAITKRGGNAFLQQTVPATARKLVQACGRLLRKEQDTGRVVILDRRLLTKSYGKAMLSALPPFSRTIEDN
ncbi:ATP-dependent DNA helicase DinG [Rheinheimera sp.]|uniref:ATP-dependent DNA helicase DinG n=1 Tax=Rheinheimera sp. TaxID=1869214 RepID=UPI00307E70A0